MSGIIWTIIIAAIIVLCVALAIRSIYRAHRRGGSCSCGCEGCAKGTKGGSTDGRAGCSGPELPDTIK